MTREELAKAIREDYIRQGVWAVKTTNITMNLDFEMLEIIREALEQELCEDTISRQAVEEMIKAEMPERGMWEIEGDKEKETVCEVCVDLMQKLSELPPVTPQPTTAHWISLDDFRGKYNENGFKCSECGEHSDFEENFCPNCGCRMFEPQESEG